MSGNFKKITNPIAGIPTLRPHDRVSVVRNIELVELLIGVNTPLPKFQELWKYEKVQVPF
jgi:hypothetical protein